MKTEKFNNLYAKTLNVVKQPDVGDVTSKTDALQKVGIDCWDNVMKMFDLSKADLGKIADAFGYESGEFLMSNVSPKTLLGRKSTAFIDKLKELSKKAAEMERSEILNSFASLWAGPSGADDFRRSKIREMPKSK